MNLVRIFLPMPLLASLALGLMAAPPAFAQVVAELNIGTPAVVSLKASMAHRFAALKPHLDKGVVGLTHDGVVAMRDAATIDIKALLALDALIGEENKDRATLYREIARANGHPEWEADLRITFGKRWINRMPVGWFYRDEKGQWLSK